MRIVPRRKQGQALIEGAITISLFVILALGVVEFGRAFFVGNYIAHAARDGARMAYILTYPNYRDSCQRITDFSTVRNQVTQELQAAGVTGMTIDFIQSCATGTSTPPACSGTPNCDPGTPPSSCIATPAGNIPYVTVCVSGNFNYMFNLPFVGTGFTVTRSATFRDEER